MDKQAFIEQIRNIIARRGKEAYLGEPVSQEAHMLQTAYQAEAAGADKMTVCAALLHDIGHFHDDLVISELDPTVDFCHEELGAQILFPYFPEKIVNCVRFHVPAKRYLCATKPDYYDELSDASKHSLELQGGPMSAQEVTMFASIPDYQDFVRIRLWDDLAKDPALITPDLEHYLPIVRDCMKPNC